MDQKLFRSKSTGEFLNETGLKCRMDDSILYNTVLSNGNGMLKNYPNRDPFDGVGLCKSHVVNVILIFKCTDSLAPLCRKHY